MSGKVCSICDEFKNSSCFSVSQYKKNCATRKCSECIETFLDQEQPNRNKPKRQKGTIISSGDEIIDDIRCMCINKILQFDETIDFDEFDFLFGNLRGRPKRVINLLIELECLDILDILCCIVLKKDLDTLKNNIAN
eukprot:TRINITY_DN3917_c0_g4_i1.p1 TRINITY_DN3917_c0_g4~~TRINITY_DN3917_c0_g4_i1.p1  ORF type:complete len:137 (+),score=19.33 TRINITY_DN3917_c0_g4_i1:136-546(+)